MKLCIFVDSGNTLRMLNKLKASGQKPIGKWDETLEPSNATADVSEWLPQQEEKGPVSYVLSIEMRSSSVLSTYVIGGSISFSGGKPGRKGLGNAPAVSLGAIPKCSAPSVGVVPTRAVGKTGGVWAKQTVHKFLRLCVPYRDNLNCPIVPKEFWMHMSDILFGMDSENLNYSWEMLREKMKVLKNYYSNCKRGKFKGSSWEFYSDMETLFNPGTCDSMSEYIIF